MPAKLLKKEVGQWPMNTYLVICEETLSSAIIDPGADAEDIVAFARGTKVEKILITHAHHDHTGALAEVKAATGAPVYLHPAESKESGLGYDVALANGNVLEVGNLRLSVIHAPGHTPGQTCFTIDDHRVMVGDTIFVGGPGKTWSPEDFSTTVRTMQDIVFAWPDETEFFPGHGPSGKLGEERPSFEAFVSRGWPSDLCGDVTWD